LLCIKKGIYMPRKPKSSTSDRDLKIILGFLICFLIYLTVAASAGWLVLIVAVVFALKNERDYEAENPEYKKYTYAGFWTRTGSLLVDGSVNIALLGPLILMVGDKAFDYVPYAIYSLIWLFIQLYTLRRWSQTPGKLVMGIKVLRADYEEIGWKEILIRSLFDIVDALGCAVGAFLIAVGLIDVNLHIVGHSFLPPDLIKDATEKFQKLFELWFFSEIFVLLTNKRRRALHDIFAGTVVVVQDEIPKRRGFWLALSCLCGIAYIFLNLTNMVFMYRAKAEKGDIEAQTMLASVYSTGMFGNPKDDVLAFQWYLKAANQGDPGAEYELGYLNENGLGVAKNKDEAIRWYSMAAKSGDDSTEKKSKKALMALGVNTP
jgi:uncharacterized RDD family membrane protein YckC